MKLITLFLTCANRQEAKKIGSALLERKLAACVRATGVKSGFWWKGRIERGDEVQLIIESSEDKFDEIETAVRQIHSYDTFVLTAYPVIQASKGVEDWVKEATS